MADVKSQRVPSRKLWLGVACAAALLGVALRARAALGDLWLDELWSLALVAPARSPLDVFWKIHHDNNHYLNSLWLLALGDGAAPVAYRALSIASGFGLVALAVAGPLSRAPAVVAVTAVLLACSRFLVQYGSEARGYGLAMCLALAAFVSLERYLARGERRWAAMFALTAALGVLSHLTFVFVLAAGVIWIAVEAVRRRGIPVLDAALLALPGLLVALLWLADVRFAQLGGAPDEPIFATVRELVRTTFGLPAGTLESLALPFLGAAVWELVSLARARDSRAAFLAALYLAPVVSFSLWRPEFLMPRYLAVLVPFTLLLVGSALGRLAQASRAGATAAVLALAVFLAGNALQLAALFRDGRGRYGEALAFMLERSASHAVAIGGFNDFRNPLVLQDQARRLGAAERVTYVDLTRDPAATPEWILVIDGHAAPDGPATFERAGRTYALARVFPYAGLSGWSWLLYRLRSPE